MGTAKFGVTRLLLAVVLALAGCGTDGGRVAGGLSHRESPAPQVEIPALPATDSRAQHDPALRVTSATVVLELPGDAYSAKADNAQADPVTHEMQLDADAGELSWALYGFGEVGPEDTPELLTIELGQTTPRVAWVALSDYAAGCWRWFRCLPENGMLRLSIADGRRMVNAAGTCYAVVAVWDNERAALVRLQLTCLSDAVSHLGVWPMSGYDRQHSGRSSLTGPASPQLSWSMNVGGIHLGLAISNSGVIYATSTNGALTAIDAQGAWLWQFAVPEFTVSSPALGEDGTIYFTCADHYLYAVDPAGKMRWSYDLGRVNFTSPVIGPDGRIYVSGLAGLYCITADGELAWAYAVFEGSRHTPAIARDGTIYFTSFYTGLYAMNPDGTLKWLFTDTKAITSAVSIGPDGTVYCASVPSAPPPDGAKAASPTMYAVSPAAEILWTAALGFEDAVPAFAADGTLYLLTASMLYALNPDGSAKWTYAGGETGGQSVAVDGNGTIYFGAGCWGDIPNNITALNPDGTLKWRWDAPAPIRSGPVVIGQDNTLYVGDESGYLLALGEQ